MFLVLFGGQIADIGEHVNGSFQSPRKKRSIRRNDAFRPRRGWINKHGSAENNKSVLSRKSNKLEKVNVR